MLKIFQANLIFCETSPVLRISPFINSINIFWTENLCGIVYYFFYTTGNDVASHSKKYKKLEKKNGTLVGVMARADREGCYPCHELVRSLASWGQHPLRPSTGEGKQTLTGGRRDSRAGPFVVPLSQSPLSLVKFLLYLSKIFSHFFNY